MPPVSFSVSEVRVAASCPRILYFDAEKTRRENLWPRAMTRIWKASGDDSTACGSLFHHSVERFNRKAHKAPEVRAVLDGPADLAAIEQGLRTFLNRQCIDLDALATKDVRQRQAFVHAIGVYMRELAQIVAYARSRGKPAGEILDAVVRRPQAPGRSHLPGRAGGRAGPRHGDPRLRLLRLEDREPSDHRLQAHPRGPADQRPLPGEPLCADAPPSSIAPGPTSACSTCTRGGRWSNCRGSGSKAIAIASTTCSRRWPPGSSMTRRRRPASSPPASRRSARSARGTGEINASSVSAPSTRGRGSRTGRTPPRSRRPRASRSRPSAPMRSPRGPPRPSGPSRSRGPSRARAPSRSRDTSRPMAPS